MTGLLSIPSLSSTGIPAARKATGHELTEGRQNSKFLIANHRIIDALSLTEITHAEGPAYTA